MQLTFSDILVNALNKENGNKDKLYKAILFQNKHFNVDDVQTAEEVFELLDKAFYKIDKAFQKGFKALIDYLSTTTVALDNIVEYRTKTPNIGTLYKLRKYIYKFEKELKFYQISKRKVPVLMGLKITFKDIVDRLEKVKPYASEAVNNIEAFKSILQEYLETSKKDYDKIDVKPLIDKLTKAENEINKVLKDVTDNRILTDRKPLKEVVSNWTELEYDVTEAIKLGTVYNMEKLEDIYIANGENIDMLNYIHDAISNNKSEMSKEAIKNLIAITDAMAKYITALGFLFYLYYQLVDMLIATIKTIELNKEDHSVVDNIAYGIKSGYDALIGTFKNIL